MDELRERVARDLARLEPPGDGLERTLLRVRRRRRNRRVGAGVLGLALTAGLVAGLWSAARSDHRPAPAVSPPGPAANGPIWFEVTGKGQSPYYGVWQVDPDGTGLVKRLDFAQAAYWEMAWSPDGTKFAFADTSRNGIYVQSPDEGGPGQLTYGVADGWPSWSPNGSEIAFSSVAGPNPPACLVGANDRCPTDIFVMDADGSNVRRLTDDPAPEFEPAWSPDGSRIAFVRAMNERAGENLVEVMDADGSNVTVVTSDAGASAHPSWSPDGSRLAFIGHRGGGVWGVYTVRADGSDPRLVELETGSFTEGPVWSPDGMLIAFVSDRGGVPGVACGTDGLCPPQLYVVHPDGTGLERLTAMPEGLGSISWRPVPEGSKLPRTGRCFVSRVSADFDGDGRPDVAVAMPTTPLAWPYCVGGLVHGIVHVEFGGGGEASLHIPCVGSDCGQVSAQDFDGDGRSELVIQLNGGASFILDGVYRATPDGISPIDLAAPGAPAAGLRPGPFRFEVLGGISDRGDVTCRTDDSGRDRLVVTRDRLVGGTWIVHRAVALLEGDRFQVVSTSETTRSSPPNPSPSTCPFF